MDIIPIIDQHETTFLNLRNKWKEYKDAYDNKPRPGSITETTTTKIKLSQGYSIVEQAKAMALANPPRFAFESRRNENYEEVQKYQDFIQYQFDKNKASAVMEEIYSWSAITGLCGWKIGWKETKKIKNKKKLKGREVTNPIFTKIAKKEKNVDVIGNWYLQSINPFDLIWNSEAKSIDDITLIGHRQTMTIAQLKANGFDTEKIQTMTLQNESYWERELNDYHAENVQAQKQAKLMSMNFNVYECYYTEVKDNIEYEKIAWVVGGEGIQDGKMLLKEVDNPFDEQFKPMGILRLVKKPGKFYGTGLIEPVTGLLNAEEDSFNMSLEALWTDIKKPMEYNPDNVLDVQGLTYGARKLIPVRHLGQSVAPLPTPGTDIGGTSFALNFLEKNKQNVTAITDYQTGADRISGQKTATEIKIKTLQSDQRSSKMQRQLENELLGPVGEMALWLNKQYLAGQDKIVYKVLGKKGTIKNEKLSFKDINGIEDVSIVKGSTSAVQREAEREKYMLLTQQAMQAMQMGVQVDIQQIFRAMIEHGFDLDTPELYLPSLKEIEKGDAQNKNKQLDLALEENENPMTARVQPEDDIDVHVPVHKAGIKAGGTKNKQYTPEELQALKEHLDVTIQATGLPTKPDEENQETPPTQGGQMQATAPGNVPQQG